MIFNPAITRALLLPLLLLASCKDRELTSYRAPKDTIPAAPQQADMGNTNDLPPGHPPIGPMAETPGMADTAVPVSEGNALSWTAPAHWKPKAPSAMRKGSYTVPGDGDASADLAVTAFPGDTGGLLANINRWRGQLGLEPIAASQVEANVTHLHANVLHIDLVDIVGKPGGVPTRMIGAIVPHQGQTWFFKFTGPDELVAREKPAFIEFVKTVQPSKS